MDAGPDGKIAATKPYFEEVEERLAGIRRNYAGKFSEAHPDFAAAVVARHADAEAALAAHNRQHGGALAAKAPTKPCPTTRGRPSFGCGRSPGGPLKDYERDYVLLSKALDGKVPADNPVLVEINTIVEAQRRWVAEAPKRKAAREAKVAAALSAKHTAALAAIRGRFKDLGTTSALHGERVGQIVWSRDKAALGRRGRKRAERSFRPHRPDLRQRLPVTLARQHGRVGSEHRGSLREQGLLL